MARPLGVGVGVAFVIQVLPRGVFGIDQMSATIRAGSGFTNVWGFKLSFAKATFNNFTASLLIIDKYHYELIFICFAFHWFFPFSIYCGFLYNRSAPKRANLLL